MMMMMILFNKVLSSVAFRRILVIFFVGLVSRCVVNYVYDINVFKDYTNSLSLIYYAFMALFTGVIYELPKISFNVFDINLIRVLIKKIVEEGLLVGDKMLLEGKVSSDKVSSDKVSLGNNTEGGVRMVWFILKIVVTLE
jgi:DMSO reductase anchor subunit